MTETYKLTPIYLNKTVSELTVRDFLKILPNLPKTCVDFSGCLPGPLNQPLIIDEVKFLTFPPGMPPGMIDEKQLPNHPVQRYLAFYGTGTILETPATKQIDVYVANQGGNDLRIDFFDVNWIVVPPFQNVPPSGVGLITYAGSNLCHVAINIHSAECLIWKVCYAK